MPPYFGYCAIPPDIYTGSSRIVELFGRVFFVVVFLGSGIPLVSPVRF